MPKSKKIVENSEIAKYIGCSTQNIDRTYEKNDDKFKFYDALQKGTFCAKHGITNKDLLATRDYLERVKR